MPGWHVNEITRTRSLHYSARNIWALDIIAQNARYYGIDDVWTARSDRSGGSLKLASDFVFPYWVAPSTWPYRQIDAFDQTDSMEALPLTHVGFGDPKYSTQIQKDWGSAFIEYLEYRFPWQSNESPVPGMMETHPATETHWPHREPPAPGGETKMKRMFVPCAAVLFVLLVAFAAQAQDKGAAMKTSTVPQTPEWRKLLALVGNWKGTGEEDGKQMPATVDVRMTGDGSAIMHVLGRDTAYEMVTMIHPDGKRLLATHYCAAHNQPRMALVPSAAPNQVAFTFVDGTNIGPGETHMKGVIFTFVDADHHEEAWSSSGGGAATVFKFARKKQ